MHTVLGKKVFKGKPSTKEQLANGCVDHGMFVDRDGYAWLTMGNTLVSKHRHVYVAHHTISLNSIYGQSVRHMCHNKRCINPEHLSLGDAGDNHADNKKPEGYRQMVRTITVHDCECIIQRIRLAGVKALTQRDIEADRFACAVSTVAKAIEEYRKLSDITDKARVLVSWADTSEYVSTNLDTIHL